ncbi:Sulfate adenylyltransferase subunit 1 [Streptomyces griseoloalbus]
MILVDARNGVVEQTRRRAAIAALLRVPHVVLAVNKMDLVDYREPVFAAIAEEFTAYATELGVPEVTAIPISALVGDNVVEPSAHMDWYGGPTVLEHLETVPVSHDLTRCHARLPVQYVIRRRAPSTPTTAATPGRSPPAPSASATRSPCCRRAGRPRSPASTCWASPSTSRGRRSR